MRDVSILGLGPMGSALCLALLEHGHKVTVWNRSSAKTEAFVKLGADSAVNVAAAIRASPVTLVCVDSYQTTRALFQAHDVVSQLPNHIVVELSTGTPKDAREAEPWFVGHGGHYLDGAILCGVPAIGTSRGLLLYSGNRQAYERCQPLLGALGGGTRFVGEEIATAATLDMAWLSRIAAEYTGIYHGAVLCQSEGVSLDLYSSVFSESDSAHFWLEPLKRNDFGNATADVAVWHKAVERIVQQAHDTGISTAVPDLVADILGRAEAAGFGHERVAGQSPASSTLMPSQPQPLDGDATGQR
jgi:3-hydroxyisobutyrate dehydrogenase-like beta-hydroxyacid dehydrogenase